MKLPEIILICAVLALGGMAIGAGWNSSQTFEECNLYGMTELYGKVFTCIEHKGE